MDRSRVAAIVEDEFPDERIRGIAAAKTGNLHDTYLIDLDTRSVAIKGGVNNPGGIEPSFDSEPHVIREVGRRTDLPVPRVLGIHMDGPPAEQYFLSEKLPGEFWLEGGRPSPAESTALAYETGRYLGMLHEAFEFEAYGAIHGDETGLSAVGEADTWRAWFGETLDRLLGDLEPESPDRLIARTRTLVDSTMDAVPRTPPSALVHYDYRLGNMLVAGDSVTGILDWEGAMAGHALQEFVKAEYLQVDHEHAEFEDPERLRERFRRGYGERRSTDFDDALYRLYRTHVILWTTYGIRAWGADLDDAEKAGHLERLEDHLDETLRAAGV